MFRGVTISEGVTTSEGDNLTVVITLGGSTTEGLHLQTQWGDTLRGVTASERRQPHRGDIPSGMAVTHS